MSVSGLILPMSVVTKSDLSRLVSELEQIDNELTTAEVRTKVGTPQGSQPTMSPVLAEFLADNKLELGAGKRQAVIEQVRHLKDSAPVLHMTFAVPADGESLRQLAQWVRTSLHPQTLIEPGLQPGLVAGVYLRTPNHVRDLSLRSLLAGQRGELKKDLEVLRAGR